MAKSIFSSSWYRVAALKPRLRSHAQIHRHVYRGETWYVLEELAMERFFRFTPAAYSVIGLMDGRSTVEEIWESACSRLADDAPTQDEMIQVLSQLYRADVLQCDVSPDAAELLQRDEEQVRRNRQNRVLSLFSWRFSVLDPERFLRHLLPVVKPLFGWLGAIVFLCVTIPGAVLFAAHWNDLTKDVLDRVLVPQNLLGLWLLFPAIKICHEFGHAFATKAFGGEVHDMGVMFLVLAPVPYVDASSASAFQEKWRRVIVGAAGMLVELFIASIAVFLWLNAEPGLVRTAAYNAIFIAGVSTVIFNANPVLRYDGYYILSDLLEIPNLRSRANAYLMYVCERYLFGNVHAESPQATVKERAWFVSFSTLSFVYRLFVVTAILLYLSNKLLNLGPILALAAAVIWSVIPLSKAAKFLFSSPRIRSVRTRAISVTVIILLIVIGLISLVPVPYRTGTEGVIWMPDESFVRAGTEGFIESIDARPDRGVKDGTKLFTLSNPVLTTQERILNSHIEELQAREIQFLSLDPVKADITRQELRQEQNRLARIREQIADLSVRSRTNGTFVVPIPQDLQGRFVRKGELMGYVVELQSVTVRTVVTQAMIDMVRNKTYSVELRLSDRIADRVPAVIKRIVPGASEQLPAKALGTSGGGEIATDPTDRQGLKAVGKVFQMDLEIPSRSQFVNLGGRGYVRFDHGWAPLAVQWYFEIRQIFLSRFNV
jgi:putative peptide zinc metalloprotease protein